jgi:L-ascorbate metabolism protein UlaG (beta-lactamase superfamily)
LSGRLTWLGHSTVLIELDGTRLLTDPLLRRWVFHLRRRVPLPRDLPKVDAILISHAHWDHLERRSLKLVDNAGPVVVPRHAGRLVRPRGLELEPGGETKVGSLTVRATSAEHRVGRRLGSPVGGALGYVISGSRSVFFAGDTDVFDGMRELAPLDAALLPVGGWGPTVPAGHMNPRRAAEALRLLKPRLAVPIHWGTYTAPFAHGEGGEEFAREAAELAPEVDVRVLAVGESVEL